MLEYFLGGKIHVLRLHSYPMPLLHYKNRLADLVENMADRALVDFMKAAANEDALVLEQGLIVDGEEHGGD